MNREIEQGRGEAWARDGIEIGGMKRFFSWGFPLREATTTSIIHIGMDKSNDSARLMNGNVGFLLFRSNRPEKKSTDFTDQPLICIVYTPPPLPYAPLFSIRPTIMKGSMLFSEGGDGGNGVGSDGQLLDREGILLGQESGTQVPCLSLAPDDYAVTDRNYGPIPLGYSNRVTITGLFTIDR